MLHPKLQVFAAWLLVGLLSTSCYFLHVAALVEQAQSAEVFADSICVNTHLRFTGTSYQSNQTQVIQLLVDAGIHNVRDDSGEVAALLAAKGIKMNFLLNQLPWNANSNITTTYGMIQTLKGLIGEGMLIDAVLGVNEPDGMWSPKNITYNGRGFPNGTIDYIRDMHTLLRQDASFDDKWIIGAPLANKGVLPANCCSQWVDFGDMHPYPFNGNYLANTFQRYDNITRYFYSSNQPSVNLDQFPNMWAQAKAYYPDRPWFATETGYSTEIGGMGTSIRAQGLYANRLFAEYFRLGIRRTCFYELLNDRSNATDHESNFGMVFANYTAKPSYTALKNLMALVRSDWVPSAAQLRPPPYALSSLEFGLNVSAVGSLNRTDYVHHLLLEKPDGVLLLLLWHEISDEDTSSSPHRQVYPPSMPTVVTLPPNYAVSLYAPNEGPGLSSTYSANGLSTFADATSISLLVPDHVIVLQLVATSDSGSTLSQASPIGLWRALSPFILCLFGLCVL